MDFVLLAWNISLMLNALFVGTWRSLWVIGCAIPPKFAVFPAVLPKYALPRILTLDGGGVRGISPVEILKFIEDFTDLEVNFVTSS